MEESKTKMCTKCYRELPLTSEYYQHNKRRKDGWSNFCKECCGTKFNIPRFDWTKEDIILLKEHFHNMSNKELVEKYFPNRSESKIANKARELNLIKDENYIKEMQIKKALKHLKKIPSQIGKDSPRYNSETVTCAFCNKQITRNQYKIKLNINHFCSRKCMSKWKSENECGENNHNFGNYWTEEMRLVGAKRAVEYLKQSDFNYRKTKPQLIIDKLLTDLKIGFENEYDCKYYLIDNYLVDNDLMIEIQGNFFHCNPVTYQNNSRKDKILHKDKSKHTYVRKYKGIEILYLWEKDINENLELCKKLIEKYIKNEGILENYHSFNYYLGDNNELKLLNKLYVIGY